MTIQRKLSWQPDLSAFAGPRYRALADAIALAIEHRQLAPGQRLPPQRKLADGLGVTVGTVTRGYAEAERRGLVSARIGSGTYVRDTDNAQVTTFLHPHEGEDDNLDLSLSLPVPNPDRERTLARIVTEIAAQPTKLRAALAYQAEVGDQSARRCFAGWLRGHGMEIDPEEMVVTQGGQHALYLALQLLLRGGESLAADALTYPGLIAAARLLSVRQQAVPMDEEGMDPEALESLCRQHRPRALYLSPDLNNPTTACLSEARRRDIVALARRYDLWIIEDSVQFLPQRARGTPLWQLAPERTLFIFSTSKILGGGLRVGLLRAPQALRETLGATLKAQCWSISGLTVATVCDWLAGGQAEDLCQWQWRELATRQALVRQYLAAYAVRNRSEAGLAWLPMPESWRAADFVAAARAGGVILLPAEPFCVANQPAPQAVRLSVSSPARLADLERGLIQLRALLDSPRLPNWQPL